LSFFGFSEKSVKIFFPIFSIMYAWQSIIPFDIKFGYDYFE
jgi:hypothetical protein